MIKDQARKLAALPSCQNCQREINNIYDFYRCWDCKMALCDQCVLHHFGQQYQPHPVILPQITEIIVGLTAASEMGMGKEPSDELLALLYKATNILKRISK